MEAASWCLLVLGLLGGVDVFVYHTLAHGLRRHGPSRKELVTHALRGPTYALLFLVTPNLALHGAWAWAFALLLVCDLAISVADFLLERESRAALGGLPAGEYLLHVLIAILFGAYCAFVGPRILAWAQQPDAILLAPPDIPDALRWSVTALAPLVLASGALDALAVVRLGRSAAQTP